VPNNSFEFQEDHFTEVLFALRAQGGRERPCSQQQVAPFISEYLLTQVSAALHPLPQPIQSSNIPAALQTKDYFRSR
jgi:hypothetical protein